MQEMYTTGNDTNVQPNLQSFLLAIEAWTRVPTSSNPDAPRRAQRILQWMSSIHHSRENDLAAPTTECFHLVLKSWANSGKLEAPIMAEHLIMYMQHLNSMGVTSVQPDTLCFNIVMSSWLKSGDITAEKRIRQIYEYMESASRSGHGEFKADASTYNIVIASISPAVKKFYDSHAARRADKILARLERGFMKGDESLRPDTIIYNQVIDYWAKTQSIRGYWLKARDVLDRQIRMYNSGAVRKCQPDVMGYTSVIAACASTYGTKKEKRHAFDVAHRTFIECCTHDAPNDVTYGIMFKGVSRLLHNREERDRYARTLFNLACDDGCLGEMAYSRFEEAVSPELLLELTGGERGGGSSYADLPRSWKRNTKMRMSAGQNQKSKVDFSRHELRP
eukprot:scaffold2206_cov193-Alexandrium_tamarense.AAC.7